MQKILSRIQGNRVTAKNLLSILQDILQKPLIYKSGAEARSSGRAEDLYLQTTPFMQAQYYYIYYGISYRSGARH